MAVDAFGDGDLESTGGWDGVGEDGAGDGDEGCVHRCLSILGSQSVAGCEEVDAVAALDGAGGAESESWESLEGEVGLLGVSIGAGDDETGGQGVDLIEGQWVVEGLGEGALLIAILKSAYASKRDMRSWGAELMK